MRLLLTLSILLATTLSFAQSEEEAVRKVFNDYRSAILNGKGERASHLVDFNSLAYYEKVLDWSKNADSVSVAELEFLDRLMVLTMRHRVLKKDLFRFNGQQLIAYSVNQGMIGKNSVERIELGGITVEDRFAKASFISNGQETPFTIGFTKQEGEWKLNLTTINEVAKLGLNYAVQQSGMTENEFIFKMLAQITNRYPGSEVWEPASGG